MPGGFQNSGQDMRKQQKKTVTVAVTGSQIVRMTRKWKYERVISKKGASPQLPPVFCLFLLLFFFSCSRVLNFADLTISEQGVGY